MTKLLHSNIYPKQNVRIIHSSAVSRAIARAELIFMEKKNESNEDEDQLWVLNTVGELEKRRLTQFLNLFGLVLWIPYYRCSNVNICCFLEEYS